MINENFTEVPNLVTYIRSTEMSRTYQVNRLGGAVGSTSTSTLDTRTINGGNNSTTQLYEDDDDEEGKSPLRRWCGIAFIVILILISLTFMILAIFYDEILDDDNENAEEYWKRIEKEIKFSQNRSRMALLNKTHQTLQNSNDYVLNLTDQKHIYSKQSITFDDLIDGQLNPKSFDGKWISGNELLHYDNQNNLCITNMIDMKKTVLIANQIIKRYRLSGYSLSSDRKYLLSVYKVKRLYRYSTLAIYKIFSIEDSILWPPVIPPEHPQQPYLHYAEWGPIGSQIIFIHKNDIYYKPNANSKPLRLTKTGKEMTIYNGRPDWVYEEEIINGPKAFWVSPDGNNLVYSSINDTLVDTIMWSYYGEYNNISDKQYPTQQALKYPKPGRHNPTVQIFVLNLNESLDAIQTIKIRAPETISKQEHYFTAIGWIDDNKLSINWLTRGQNLSIVDICDQDYNWKCNSSFSIESSTSWIDLNSAPVPAIEHNSLLIRLPELISKEAGYYRHVALIGNENKTVKYLTIGFFDVIEVMAYNQIEDNVYFMSTLPDKPEVRHLMSVSINDEKLLDPICLTCHLGNSCNYNNVEFSITAEYYILHCDGPQTPRVEIRKTENNSLVLEIENNESLDSKLKLWSKVIPKTRKMKIKTSGKFYSNVELVLPPNFDENKKYPLMVEVYAGPGSQIVIDKYRTNHWGSHLASNMGIIYARIDGRGSDNKGSKYLHEIYKNMGNVEVMDIITATRYIRDNLTFVDNNNIGIWGWSYGGYAALMSLALDHTNPVFKCGIAVAPVTNWMFYDSVYVERYMGWPNDNIMAYNRSDLLNKASLLRGKKILLAFGTADDNVHSQNSMLLMSKLNEIGLIYETQIYPDNNHSLRGATIHLYKRMNEFLERHFFH